MHPAEKAMIAGALEQIEASVRTLRKYLAYSNQPAVESSVRATSMDAQADEDGGEDEKLIALMSQIMGGTHEPSAL